MERWTWTLSWRGRRVRLKGLHWAGRLLRRPYLATDSRAELRASRGQRTDLGVRLVLRLLLGIWVRLCLVGG